MSVAEHEPIADPSHPDDATWVRMGLFSIGMLIALTMVLRSQVRPDQVQFLHLGWQFYAHGELIPFGSTISGGGLQPGSLMSLLSALPLFVWQDYRAIGIAVLIAHVIAYLLLDRVVREAAGPRERLLLCVFYWLNPWRLFHSTFVWNPNWLFLLGALHLWSAWRMRQRPRFWMTFAHALTIGLAFQLHSSFLILAVLSVLLWRGGRICVQWGGFTAAVGLALLSLVPWLIEVRRMPELLPDPNGYIGRGLVTVYPVLRGVLYWFRYASLNFGSDMMRLDLVPTFGAAAQVWIAGLLKLLAWIVGPPSVIVAIVANVKLWRERAPDWLTSYARRGFVAAVITYALSPSTIMSWFGFAIFHAAILPLVLWLGAVGGSPRARREAALTVTYAVVSVVMAMTMAIGSPQYRRGGEDSEVARVVELYPFIIELGVADRCAVEVHPDGESLDLVRRAKLGLTR